MNNVGKIDRLIRFIAAVGILILHATHVIPEENADIFLIGAALLAMTALRKCCPLYALLGFGTCSSTSTANPEDPKIPTKKLDL
jgi:hypothetical protein